MREEKALDGLTAGSTEGMAIYSEYSRKGRLRRRKGEGYEED